MKLETKHLAPYLPYELKVSVSDYDLNINGFIGEICSWELNDAKFKVWSSDGLKGEVIGIRSIRPILRPLSSMTKEEANDLLSIAVFGHKTDHDDIDHITLDVDNDSYIVISGIFKGSFYDDHIFKLYVIYDNISFTVTVTGDKEETSSMVNLSMYEYLFENHFDIFGLINNALAIEK